MPRIFEIGDEIEWDEDSELEAVQIEIPRFKKRFGDKTFIVLGAIPSNNESHPQLIKISNDNKIDFFSGAWFRPVKKTGFFLGELE